MTWSKLEHESYIRRRTVNQKFISKNVFFENVVENWVSAYTCVQIFGCNIHNGNKLIVKNFFIKNIPNHTLYDVLQHYYKRLHAKRQLESVGIHKNTQNQVRAVEIPVWQKQESVGLFQVYQIQQFIEPLT